VSRFHLSLNQITLNRLSVAEVVQACHDGGIRSIGLWREKVAETGREQSARLIADADLTVSSLCRGGFFNSRGAFLDNRRAVDDAAALGAPVLVLVCGGLPDGTRDLDLARARVAAGLEDLVPYAAKRGVRLGIEPLHPMFCSDRSVVCTLGQALDLAERFPPEQVGVVVDVYHVWWDPRLDQDLSRAHGRIAGFHINDWMVPLPEGALLGRGLPGTGCIDLPRIMSAVARAGYEGAVEVEVMNERVWEAPVEETIGTLTTFFDGLEQEAGDGPTAAAAST